MTAARSRHYCMMVTGDLVDFVYPDPSTVSIDYLAHGLAAMPRWAGQTRWSPEGWVYNVAQHSYHVAELVAQRAEDPLLRLCALLHDSAEGSSCADVPTPLKRLCEGYTAAELRVLASIFKAHGIPEAWAHDLPAVVKEADHIMLATEARDICHHTMREHVDISVARPQRIERIWSHVESRDAVLRMYLDLMMELTVGPESEDGC